MITGCVEKLWEPSDGVMVCGKFCYNIGKPDANECILAMLSAMVDPKPELSVRSGPPHRPNQILLAYRFKKV
jgi:hypothetical protein